MRHLSPMHNNSMLRNIFYSFSGRSSYAKPELCQLTSLSIITYKLLWHRIKFLHRLLRLLQTRAGKLRKHTISSFHFRSTKPLFRQFISLHASCQDVISSTLPVLLPHLLYCYLCQKNRIIKVCDCYRPIRFYLPTK